MEFSFDRSKETHLRNSTQSSGPTQAQQQQPQQAQAAAAQPQQQYDDGIDTSTIANERLRKAIERNRARQAERNRQAPPQMSSQPQQAQQAPQEQASLFDKPQAQERMQETVQAQPEPQQVYQEPQREMPREEAEPQAQQMPPRRPRAQERARSSVETRSSAIVTRKSVARPDEADFTPAKRAPKKVASQISYSTSGSRKKTKSMDPTIVGYLVKGAWIFCAIMVLRLVFANGGVTDFYSRRSVYNDRLGELDRIKKENMQLVREIERMQTDVAFQKKLVRDNLGFIASDEFLVLFPKEKQIQ